MHPFTVQTDSSQVALRLSFKKPFIGGMSNSTITHVELDVDKDCYWKLDVITPALSVFGEYEIDGKLMMFELNGHGRCNITTLDLHHTQTMKCERYKKNGKDYIRVTDYQIKAKPAKVVYYFEELVPNNNQITQAILDTFNGEEESMLIYDELSTMLVKYIAEMHKITIQEAFNHLPLDEFFPL
ncbi:unnamed protein product [Acanthoscelides obtectus]|nr:unnamed protein product [Acanthoscelides obtectus]CAK1662567.1 Protein takeout [Acanthoscelides obtectus]